MHTEVAVVVVVVGVTVNEAFVVAAVAAGEEMSVSVCILVSATDRGVIGEWMNTSHLKGWCYERLVLVEVVLVDVVADRRDLCLHLARYPTDCSLFLRACFRFSCHTECCAQDEVTDECGLEVD